HGRGLPGAVWPEETEHLTVADLKGDVLERDPVTEALAQATDGDRRGASVRLGCRHRRHETRSRETVTLHVDGRLVVPGYCDRRLGWGRGAASQFPAEP